MRPISLARRAALGAAVGMLALALATCNDQRGDPVGPGGRTTFQIRLRGAVAGTDGAFARIDAAHVVLTQADAVRLDTTVTFAGTGTGDITLSVQLPDPTGTVTIALTLLSGSQELFRGGGSAELKRGTRTSVPISVAPVAASLVAPDSVTLTALGDTVRLRAAVLFVTGDTVTAAQVTWADAGGGDPGYVGQVMQVTADGLVTAHQEGQAQATATYQTFTHVTTVRVRAAVAAVVLSADTFSVLVDSTYALSAVVRDRNGNTLQRMIAWITSDPGVATVDANGSVRGLKPGTAIITASSGVTSASATVTVRVPPVAAVQVTPTSASVLAGDTVRFTATTLDAAGHVLTGRPVAWASSNGQIAFIVLNGNGLVQGLSAGTATITATSEGRSGTASLTVVQPLVSVSGNAASFTHVMGSPSVPAAQALDVTNGGDGILSGLTATIAYDPGGPGSWLTATLGSTTAPTSLRLAVNPAGLPPGNYGAVVTVSSTVTGSGSAQVNVGFTVIQAPVATVQLTPTSGSVLVGDTLRFVATTLDAAGHVLTGRTIAWASSNPVVASVSPSGLVTGLAGGSAVIAAVSEGQLASARVNVMQPLVAVDSTQLLFTPAEGGPAGTQTASVTNAGSGRLSGLSATVTYTGRVSGWLTATLDSATAPTTLRVTANPGSLAAGQYTATVTVASTIQGAGTDTVAVVMSVQPQPRVGVYPDTGIVKTVIGMYASDTAMIRVFNAGSGTLSDFTASTPVYAAGEQTGWLSGLPVTSTNVPILFNVAMNSYFGNGQGLGPGTYHATITVSSSVAGSGTVDIPVRLVVQQPQIGLSLSEDSVYLTKLRNDTTTITRDVDISNIGTGTLSGLTVTVAYPIDEQPYVGNWLTWTLDSATAPATLTVAASGYPIWRDDSGNTLFVRHATLTISSSVSGVTPVQIAVTCEYTGGW